MTQTPNAADAAKRAAALGAVTLVAPGMRVGLGTGSTSEWFVRGLAERAAGEALDLTCAATSRRTAELAAALGLRVIDLDDAAPLDLTVDGADEIDPEFRLLKGGGGAHLREKIVAAASARMVAIAGAGKLVAHLGAFPLPVEITPFGHATTLRLIARALERADVDGRDAVLRARDGTAVITDEGNLIADLHLGRIGAPEALADDLLRIPGVIETGLFLDICAAAVIGEADGRAALHRPGAAPEPLAVASATDLPAEP